jgi:integrase
VLADDVGWLADESGQHRALVLVLAYCAIRWGEVIGLRVVDVEFLRRRLLVSETAVQLGVDHAVGPTKGRKARSVPVPAFVLDELSVRTTEQRAADGGDDHLVHRVFSPSRAYLPKSRYAGQALGDHNPRSWVRASFSAALNSC